MNQKASPINQAAAQLSHSKGYQAPQQTASVCVFACVNLLGSHSVAHLMCPQQHLMPIAEIG